MLMTLGTPISIFGSVLKTYGAILTVAFGDTKIFNIVTSSSVDDDDPGKTVEVFRNMLEVAKALRYKGRSLNVTGLSPERLAIDLAPSLRMTEANLSILRPKFNSIWSTAMRLLPMSILLME